jgi:hypothetical protein
MDNSQAPPPHTEGTPVITTHWTQTPEGRKRMAEINKQSAAKRLKTMRAKHKKGGIFQHLTPPQQKAKRAALKSRKMSLAMKKSWADRQEQAPEGPLVNGHASATAYEFPVSMKMRSRGWAKDSLRALAIEGAKVKRAALLQELEMLNMFLGEKQ